MTVPAVGRRLPKISCASSVRPAPIRPPKPTTSPARISNDTSSWIALDTCSTVSTGAPGALRLREYIASSWRPTIMRTSSFSSVSPASFTPTSRPSRSTATRSAMRKISFIRCET